MLQTTAATYFGFSPGLEYKKCSPGRFEDFYSTVHKKYLALKDRFILGTSPMSTYSVRWESRMTFISVHSRFDLTAICEKEVDILA